MQLVNEEVTLVMRPAKALHLMLHCTSALVLLSAGCEVDQCALDADMSGSSTMHDHHVTQCSWLSHHMFMPVADIALCACFFSVIHKLHG